MNLEIFHADHGITKPQWDHVQTALAELDPEAFFIHQVDFPADLGTVPCGLYGPAMGDAPVPRDEVEMVKRGDPGDKFRWLDPLVDRPARPVSYVQVIGIRMGTHSCTIYTCYGGPLAPQNPEDPGNPDPEGAAKFWSEHALARP